MVTFGKLADQIMKEQAEQKGPNRSDSQSEDSEEWTRAFLIGYYFASNVTEPIVRYAYQIKAKKDLLKFW